jgi:hypothetical protein
MGGVEKKNISLITKKFEGEGEGITNRLGNQ